MAQISPLWPHHGPPPRKWRIGMIIALALAGIIEAILVLRIGKHYWLDEPQELNVLVAFVVLTVNLLLFALPSMRFAMTIMWIVGAAVSLLALVVGIGIELNWLVEVSLQGFVASVAFTAFFAAGLPQEKLRGH